MNTIPLTPNDHRSSYTVIGGKKSVGSGLPVSVVVLNRGTRLYRSDLLAELTRMGFASILSVESGPESLETESLAGRFPQVRFLVFKEDVGPGERVNVAMRESASDHVLVIWNDAHFVSSALSSRFFERISELDRLCLVPMLLGPDGEPVPSCSSPAYDRRNLRVIHLPPVSDGDKSLFPFDYCGIYSREKFALSGGYDWTISNPHWQKLDFGFRAWLWGEEIRLAQALRLAYGRPPPADDATPDRSYARFFVKNIAPVLRSDHGTLPWSRFARFALGSRSGLSTAIAEFRGARKWTAANAYRFKADASMLVGLWDPLA